MRNKQRRLAEIKYQLREKRERKVKRVIWKLTQEQKHFVESIGYGVKPFIYEIKTRAFYNVKNSNATIKDIHWAYKNGKRSIFRKLKQDEVKILDEHGIEYRVSRYEIILR